mgnify:CR=1 FL=1
MSASKKNDGGFTLLEVLIALSLTALLSILLLGGLRFTTSAWHKLQAENSVLQELHHNQSSIRRILKNTLPLEVPGTERVDFQGTARQVSIVVSSLAEKDNSGLKLVIIGTAPSSTGIDLQLSWKRYRYDTQTSHETSNLVLSEGVDDVQIRYFGNQSSIATADKWHSTWRNQTKLPKLVALKLTYPDHDKRVWPELFIALELSEK